MEIRKFVARIIFLSAYFVSKIQCFVRECETMYQCAERNMRHLLLLRKLDKEEKCFSLQDFNINVQSLKKKMLATCFYLFFFFFEWCHFYCIKEISYDVTMLR